MVIKALIWDEKNTDHIRKHHIRVGEVKEAVFLGLLKSEKAIENVY